MLIQVPMPLARCPARAAALPYMLLRLASSPRLRSTLPTIRAIIANANSHMQLYYTLPHYHSLATLMRIQMVGGPLDGQSIFETRSSIGEPLGRQFMAMI